MPFDFTGKRVLVAGGSRGIGRAIALQFAAAGADVALCARGAATLEATRADVARHGHRVHAMTCDLADAASIAAWVPAAAEALGGIDVLVNNASGFGMGDDEEGWAAGLSVDVLAMVRSSRAALPWLLRAAGGASIIHISSIAAFRPSTRTAAYAAVKAAMNSYTGSQAAMLSRQGIRVNAIAPGLDRIPGRRLGPAQERESRPLRTHAQEHPVRPLRHARRGRRGGAVPGLAARSLGDGAGPQRRRRAVAGGVGSPAPGASATGYSVNRRIVSSTSAPESFLRK